MSLLDTRRLLAFCGLFIASNAMKHFLWDSGHHLANPRIQEEASDPITLSLDSKKAGGSLQVEVQEDTTYHNLKSAQSNHHDEHAMCSLNRELHDAGAELRLNSVNLSPVTEFVGGVEKGSGRRMLKKDGQTSTFSLMTILTYSKVHQSN
ncbi:hypothetical protein PGTUg99_013857 [Puccinia graminis f. sp. tritici]|uniref:Uncharacterized protein n=1 Tax=Puccinia graminis f. sp. tritici TaxID=56615 RepID=A0A5B0QG73_PUCGR|nr:hypothetical protein PGTUg99_013857 [Puccinia graminis f. sp. tritici]